MPSRSIVALISSDLRTVTRRQLDVQQDSSEDTTHPGVIMKGVAVLSPAAEACRAIEATLAMSS